MKKSVSFLFSLFAVLVLNNAAAQNENSVRFVDATELNIIGKLSPTPMPYQRIDTAVYKPLTESESSLLLHSTGLAVVFRTNSTKIAVSATYRYRREGYNMTPISQSGFDLHIKQDGEWLYAASNVPRKNNPVITLISNMDDGMKECLMYLPLFSEPETIMIGIDEGAVIEPIDNPFSYKVAVFGSSFTHGASAGRAGLTYPAIIQRRTGLDIINFGMSGNSKLQPTIAHALADSDADAFLFDAFSNPSAEQIEERLLPFIEIIRQKHPETPLIFMNTIYRESRNFDLKSRANEEAKQAAAEKMMKQAMKQYPNVYFINIPDKTGNDHLTSIDGVHPGELGFLRWADAVQPELERILKKHGRSKKSTGRR